MRMIWTCRKLRQYSSHTVVTYGKTSGFTGQQSWEILMGLISAKLCPFQFSSWAVVQCYVHCIPFEIAFFLSSDRGSNHTSHWSICTPCDSVLLLQQNISLYYTGWNVCYLFTKWIDPYSHGDYCHKVVPVEDRICGLSDVLVNVHFWTLPHPSRG